MLASQTSRTACHACGHAYAADALFCPNCGTAKARDNANDPLLGTVIGDRYELQELVGQGASGSIYRAVHVTLRRKLAVKVLHHELSRDDLAIERFRRAATTVGQIENDHIVVVHDFGRAPDNRLYLAMEYLEGETLDERLAAGPLAIDEVVNILIQLGEALVEAHAIGYVHRDLRPRNLFLAVRRGEANFLKLLDFGLSKLVASEGEAATTSLGMTFGDPHYMSPEQARGEPIDRRADIYSMGCIAYQMLTGEPPFSGGRVFDVLERHVGEVPQPPSTRRPDTPRWLEALVMRCLEKRPGHRFVTVYRVVEALREGLATGETMDAERAREPEIDVPASVSRVWAMLADQLDADGRVGDADDTRFGADTEVTDMAELAGTPAPGSDAAAPEVAPPPVDPGRQTQLGIGAAGSELGPRPKRASARIVTPVTDDLTEPSAAPQMEASSGVPAVLPAEPTPPPRPGPRSKVRPVVKLSTSTITEGIDRLEELEDPEDLRVTRAVAGTSAARSGEPPAGRDDAAPTGDDAPIADAALVADAAASGDTDAYDDDEYYYDDEYDDEPAGKRGRDPADSEAGISADWFADGEAFGDSDPDLPAVDEPDDSVLIPRKGAAYAGDDDGEGKLKWVIGGVGAVVAILAIVLIARGAGGDDPKPAGSAGDATASSQPGESGAAATGPAVALDAARAEVAIDASAETASATPEPEVKPEPVKPEVKPEPVKPKPDKPEVKPAAKPDKDKPKPDRPKPDKPKPDKPKPDKTKPDKPEPDRGKPSDDDRRRADFFAQLGHRNLAGGNIPGAAKEFRKALKLDPANGRAVTGLGQIALRQGSFTAAVKHLKRAARLRSGSSSVHTLLGEAYLGAGNRGAASEAFKQALRLNPDSQRARRGLAESGG